MLSDTRRVGRQLERSKSSFAETCGVRLTSTDMRQTRRVVVRRQPPPSPSPTRPVRSYTTSVDRAPLARPAVIPCDQLSRHRHRESVQRRARAPASTTRQSSTTYPSTTHIARQCVHGGLHGVCSPSQPSTAHSNRQCVHGALSPAPWSPAGRVRGACVRCEHCASSHEHEHDMTNMT
jgi:hypothetical protein